MFIFLIHFTVPVTERWRDELKSLTEGLTLPEQQQQPQQPRELERPRTQYSEKTGRIIPPPSRAMSRGQSRGQSRGGRPMPNLQHISAEPDSEAMVCFRTLNLKQNMFEMFILTFSAEIFVLNFCTLG